MTTFGTLRKMTLSKPRINNIKPNRNSVLKTMNAHGKMKTPTFNIMGRRNRESL